MDKLKNLDKLLIRQHTKWGEVFSGIEMRNSYDICDENGNIVYNSGETGGSFLTRIFLRALRPFTISVFDIDGSLVLTCKRPFKFMFHEIHVFDKYDQPIGSAKWQFSFLKHRYKILDNFGNEIFKIDGTIFHPWTFKIYENNVEVGVIHKKWMGMLKEMFTKTDYFGVQFPINWSPETKGLFLGVVFLIDFVHFEHSK